MASPSQTCIQIVSVFVHNIPPNIHWRWLRQIFQHHGKVTEVFIPQKRSKTGKKYGFVRFSNFSDAKNAVERLNGAWFLDYKLEVYFAKYNAGPTYWRRISPQKFESEPENASNDSPPTNRKIQLGSIDNQEVIGGDKQGEQERLDEGTCEKERLDYAKILVSLNKNKLFMHSIEFKINGEKFVLEVVVEDNIEIRWKRPSSTVQVTSSNTSFPSGKTPPAVAQTGDNGGHELPDEKANNGNVQTINEPTSLNDELNSFEAKCQESYDEQIGFLDREYEMGGNFELNPVDEIQKAEIVAKETGLNTIVNTPNLTTSTIPLSYSKYPDEDNEAMGLIIYNNPVSTQFGDEMTLKADTIHEDSEDEARKVKQRKKFISISSLQSVEVSPGKKKSAPTKRKGKKSNRKANFSRKKENNLMGNYSDTPSFLEDEITDEDIMNRNKALRNEAQATLDVARLLGLSPTADEEDIIKCLMEAEIEEMARNICSE